MPIVGFICFFAAMEINHYFRPINPDDLPQDAHGQSWFTKSQLYIDIMPGLDEAQIAVIGFDDRAADNVRKELYRLSQIYQLEIVDLGNIITTIDPEDTEFAISHVMSYLQERKVIPIFISADNRWDYAIYRGFEDQDLMVTMGMISPNIDLGKHSPLSKMVVHKPNFLFNLSLLAYQTYMTDPLALEAFQHMYFDAFRLGWVNTHMEEVEPVLRSCDMLSLDMRSVRMSDAPGITDGSPNGLFGDEVCRLARYGGMGQSLKVFMLNGINISNDINNQTAKLAAQIIWYVVDGFMARHRENPEENPDDFFKFVIGLKDNAHSINFYKSKRTERWWMEVPTHVNRHAHHGPHMVPCSYQDYQQACKDEIPERWWNMYQKFLV